MGFSVCIVIVSFLVLLVEVGVLGSRLWSLLAFPPPELRCGVMAAVGPSDEVVGVAVSGVVGAW